MYNVNFLGLVLFAVVSSVYSVGNICNGGSVSQPDNNQPFYWPTTWNENQTAPKLAGNQGCNWYVSVPTGYYVKLVISGKVTDGDRNSWIRLYDSYGTVYQEDHDKASDPWFFPSPRFQISVYTQSEATFAFKVSWHQYPSSSSTNKTAIGVNPQVVSITQTQRAYTYGAVTGISLLAFPENKNYYSLRSTLVFEGSDWNGRFVNNLYEIHKTGQQWISSGNSVYIVNLEAKNSLDKLLVQESGYTVAIDPYQQMNCAASSVCSNTLHGKKSKSGLVYVGSQYQTLLDISMDSNATLSVYYGSPNSAGFHTSYTGNTIRSQLPLTFGGSVTQYIVSSGKSMFTFKLS